MPINAGCHWIEAVRRVVAAVRVPVTADVEGGYGSGTPDDVAATVRGVIEAGAVGINLEDGPGRRSRARGASPSSPGSAWRA